MVFSYLLLVVATYIFALISMHFKIVVSTNLYVHITAYIKF